MGNLLNREQRPPMVLVPPIFDFPPLAVRTRMLVPAYELLFGKLAVRCLFEDYFEQARHFNTRILLKPIQDPHVDLVATIAGPFDGDKEGNAVFRWQRDLDDPNTFMEAFVSTEDPFWQLRSCFYYPKFGFGIFGIFPLVRNSNALLGLRYGSENLSLGTTFLTFHSPGEFPKNVWLVGRTGRLCAGVLYEPPSWGILHNAERKILPYDNSSMCCRIMIQCVWLKC